MCRLCKVPIAHSACQGAALLAEADAEARFRSHAERGAGREERGLELLRKAAGAQVERRGER